MLQKLKLLQEKFSLPLLLKKRYVRIRGKVDSIIEAFSELGWEVKELGKNSDKQETVRETVLLLSKRDFPNATITLTASQFHLTISRMYSDSDHKVKFNLNKNYKQEQYKEQLIQLL